MSSSKTLAEMALRCRNVVGDIPGHERLAVLKILGALLEAEQVNETLAIQARSQAPMSAPTTDEHYRQ